jgi:hypothetical protein
MLPTFEILFEDDALIFINKPAGAVVRQRMHHPDELYLHADVARHTSPAYLMQRLDRETSAGGSERATYAAVRAETDSEGVSRCLRGVLSRSGRPLMRRSFAWARSSSRYARAGKPRSRTSIHCARRLQGHYSRSGSKRGERMSAIGHPLAGDWRYGLRNAVRPIRHAAEIEMTQPLTNEPLRAAARFRTTPWRSQTPRNRYSIGLWRGGIVAAQSDAGGFPPATVHT